MSLLSISKVTVNFQSFLQLPRFYFWVQGQKGKREIGRKILKHVSIVSYQGNVSRISLNTHGCFLVWEDLFLFWKNWFWFRIMCLEKTKKIMFKSLSSKVNETFWNFLLIPPSLTFSKNKMFKSLKIANKSNDFCKKYDCAMEQRFYQTFPFFSITLISLKKYPLKPYHLTISNAISMNTLLYQF